MYQIDNSTAAQTQPPSTPAGTPGYFTDGNPATNVAATIFPAEFANTLMLEVANVITSAGMTLDKTKFNQLYTAIQTIVTNDEANGTTPPQFDNSKKMATTEFVHRQGLQASQMIGMTASLTITAAHAGASILGSSGSPTTGTLPLANSVPRGVRIEFFNIGSGAMTLVRSGSDTISFNSASLVSSTVLNLGDTLTLESDGASQWFCVGGSLQLGNAAVFGSFLSANGYQKLPSGLIIQWGSAAANSAGQVGFVFPMVFPNYYFASYGVYLNGTISPQPSAITVAEVATTASTGSCTYIVSGGGAGVANANVRIFVIGR